MSKSKFIVYVPSLIISLLSSISESSSSPNIGFTFTADLIHRDSPQSPSYNPSLTPFQRTINSLKRSSHHRRRFNEATAGSPLIYSGGDYLMKYSVGSPPVPSLGIADTGSDVIWTQCQPCITCFNQSLPIFNPKTSHTYTKIPCKTKRCNSLTESYCGKEKNCLYTEQYGDQSYSYGELATDTFTLAMPSGKKTVSYPNIMFGCGFKNGGIFSGSESGIVGLGGGKTSLIRQLGGGKFAYCLNSFSGSSKLRVGSNSIGDCSEKRAVSTPLVKKSPETYYYLTLEGISVGNDRLLSGSGYEGNMIIDSGTTLTFLPMGLYDEVKKAMKRAIKLKTIDDPSGMLSLCFYTRKDIENIPKIVVRFKGAADVKLSHENVFVRTSDVAVCLALAPTEDLAIYGNVAQLNFLVGYDLDKRTVSFKPADCGKL